MTPLLDIKNVSRHFGGVRAVEGFSGQVRRGERVGLIGPNGAGTFDWCNDPEDAWDIIYRHRIGVIPARQPGEWRAAHRKVDSSTPQHLIQNPNPFRAAMTVFLLMQEKKHEETV